MSEHVYLHCQISGIHLNSGDEMHEFVTLDHESGVHVHVSV